MFCSRYPSKDTEGEDYIDMGASILDFYSSLVNLLGKCAPDSVILNFKKAIKCKLQAFLCI